MFADPRLLLIDPTPMDGPAATSALKTSLLGDWREDALVHVLAGEGDFVGLAEGGGPTRWFKPGIDAGAALVEAFAPQVILYRPTADHPRLHAFALSVVGASPAPLALWLMDDWPERLRVEDPARFASIDEDLRRLLVRSALNLAISPGMAEAFRARYGVDFAVIRNGVAAADWPDRPRPARRDVVVRYAGSLAPDTTRESVLAAARATSNLNAQGVNVRFEGRTQANWFNDCRKSFSGLPGVCLRRADMSAAGYRAWLAEADIALVAYNFDPATERYLRFSFANKLPEALASRAAVLAVGPAGFETMGEIARSGAAHVVVEPGVQAIEAALGALVADPALRDRLGRAGRAFAFERFDLSAERRRLREGLGAIARAEAFEPEDDADARPQFDECRFVFHALGAQAGGGVMLDVGAHVGGSLEPFARAGWRVLAFEPDPVNRAALLARASGRGNVKVLPHAVGARAASGAAFYASQESTGVSSLSPFLDTHRECARVEVVTLDDAIADQGFEAVDFLKIDVEGHELDVLDGFDLSRIKPRAIVAEFEDAKTRARGFGVDDLAGRFVAAGYEVWASEWRPIERYGVTHVWRRLRRYPCEIPGDAWGNLVAFRDPPEPGRFLAAFAAARRGGSAGRGAAATLDAIAGPAVRRGLYRRAADWLVIHAPGPARILRGPAVRMRDWARALAPR